MTTSDIVSVLVAIAVGTYLAGQAIEADEEGDRRAAIVLISTAVFAYVCAAWWTCS